MHRLRNYGVNNRRKSFLYFYVNLFLQNKYKFEFISKHNIICLILSSHFTESRYLELTSATIVRPVHFF